MTLHTAMNHHVNIPVKSTDTTNYQLQIDIDSIIDTFDIGANDGDIHKRPRRGTRRRKHERKERRDIVELLQNAPTDELFALLAAGQLIDWTVLQHMSIIASSSPVGVPGERLYPIQCDCVDQIMKEGEEHSVLGEGKRQRKRKRKRKVEGEGTEIKGVKRRKSYTSETAVMLDLPLDTIAFDTDFRAALEQLSACQAGSARRKKQRENKSESEILWVDHKAFLEDVRSFANFAGLQAFGGSEADNSGPQEAKVEEEIVKTSEEVQAPKQRGARSRKRKREKSATTKMSTSTNFCCINDKKLGPRYSHESNTKDHENIDQPEQLTKKYDKTSATKANIAGQPSPITAQPKPASQMVIRNTAKSKAKDTASSVRIVRSSNEKTEDVKRTKPRSSRFLVRDAEPTIEEKSHSADETHLKELHNGSVLQMNQNTSAASDISDLTSCPASPLSSISPPTPGNTVTTYSIIDPVGQSRLKISSSSPPNLSDIPERSSFCLQYMKPDVAKTAYGLIQEALVDDPFALLVAVTLLNRTKGTVAVPILFTLMSDYPTAEKLAFSPVSTIATIIARLGLQNNRAKSLVSMARRWHCEGAPPRKGFRYRTLHYPYPGAGSAIRPGEVIADEDEDPREGAFEIGHLPGVGPYALDSWRIFCRDMLRGLAKNYNGEGADRSSGFEPEWKRVLPKDKELRGFLRWMWAKEGIDWNPLTGEKRKI